MWTEFPSRLVFRPLSAVSAITYTSPQPAWDRAISGVCDFVRVRVCRCVRGLKGKRLELSSPNSVHVYFTTIARHALTRRSKGQKVKVTHASPQSALDQERNLISTVSWLLLISAETVTLSMAMYSEQLSQILCQFVILS